jgi:hypothetical protein
MGITIEYSGGTSAEGTVIDAAAPGRVRMSGGPRTRARPDAVTVAFGLVVAVSAVYFVGVTSDSWFFADEWAMARQVQRTRDIVDPYNGHLSVTILGLYRVLLELFGFTTHLPYRVAGVASFVAVPVAMFVVTRRGVGAAAAAIAGLLLLWFRGMGLEPGALNHSLALLGAIVCAGALTGRGRRNDILVGASLAFALGSSGGGVPVAVAAVVHSLCSRATRWRWLAVLVPSAAWLAWRVVFVPADPAEIQELRPGVLELARGAVRQAVESFRFLALGNRAIGWVLLALFLAYAAWRARQGLVAAANVLAWTAGLLAWWFGLMWSRLFLADPDPIFRYEWVSAGFVLLALLPTSPVARPAWQMTSNRRAAVLAVTGVLLVAAFLAHSVQPDVEDFARQYAVIGRHTRGQAAVMADPNIRIAPDVELGFEFAHLTTGRVTGILGRYGAPGGAGETDELLVETGAVRLTSGPEGPPPPGCEELRGPDLVAPDSRIELYASVGTPEVQVRRFVREWVTVGRLQEGRLTTLVLPGYLATAPWQVSSTEPVCARLARN